MKNFNSLPKVLPIKKIIIETDKIRTFVFEANGNGGDSRGGGGSPKCGDSKPGQFVMMWIPGVDEKPFSIAYDDGKEFWLTIADVGAATDELFKLKVGDLVGIRGPFGTFYKFEKGDRLALLAGGYGAAPMFNVAMNAVKIGCKVEFIVGARSKNLLLYKKQVGNLAKVAGKYKGKITYHAATNDGSYGYKGFNTDVLEKILAKQKIDKVFACGPEIMMEKAVLLAKKYGAKSQISLERYMKCGFGVCGQCCIDGSVVRCCKEGPVFDGEVALKFSEFGKYHRDSVGRKVAW